MAMTFQQNLTSQKFYLANNPINLTVDSTNSGNCNFRYIVDVYVNGVKVFRDKRFPDPTTGYGFHQIDRVVQDYISDNILKSPASATFTNVSSSSSPNSLIEVYCKVGEEYDVTSDCTGTVIQYQNLLTSNTIYVFNGVEDYETFYDFNYNDYRLVSASASTSKLFLTNSSREREVTYNDSEYLEFISLTAPTAFTVMGAGHVALYRNIYYKDGTTSATYSNAPSLNAYKRYRLAIGPYDINNIENDSTINQTVSKYTIKLVWQTGNSTHLDLTEEFTFKVKCPSTPNESNVDPSKFQTRIGFIGRLGTIEHYTFEHRRKINYKIERGTFRKSLQSNYGGQWRYQVGDRQSAQYKVSAQQEDRVSSYVRRKDSNWLSDELYPTSNAWVYKRPELYRFHIYREDSTPTSRMLFILQEGHGLEAGDSIICLPNYEPSYSDYNAKFTAVSVSGNLVDFGLTFNNYNLTNTAYGFFYKYADWEILPIDILDENVEEKQYGGKPIEYSLIFRRAYAKNTLRP